MKIVYPNYKNSIVNLSSTILEAYDIKSNHSPLKQINISELKKKKNIILMIYDGLGYNMLKNYGKSEKSILCSNIIDRITSVFPSTTSTAITSILSNLTPLEHGVLGWSLFFKELSRVVDVLPWRDSFTGDIINSNMNFQSFFKFESIFDKLQKVENLKTYYILPNDLSSNSFSKNMAANADIVSSKSESIIKQIEKIVSKDSSRKFIFVYNNMPDSFLHYKGSDSIDLYEFLKEEDESLSSFTENLMGSDTSLIISSDHGMVDIKKRFEVNIFDKLYDSLLLPPFPEKRFLSLFVKDENIDIFFEEFDRIKDDFILLDKKSFLKDKLLGTGIPHKKINDFLGNYFLIAKSDGILDFTIRGNCSFVSAHAGICDDEMNVPLIQINI
ncbi:MAG: alkaline phosphatase family protein [Candidatus Delongbacteria bacterium]|nr:alkaline phosphatase family protein [Candidatus Delongbacteria bacterium]MBN2834465.1 alkaline phosphatase family protein [Candidatus Delongbacteria bacterium]